MKLLPLLIALATAATIARRLYLLSNTNDECREYLGIGGGVFFHEPEKY